MKFVILLLAVGLALAQEEEITIGYTEAAVETTPEPVAETTPEPVVETTPEPVVETTPEPVAETTPEPVAETTPEPVVETTPEPVAETTPEPVAETTPEPVTETTPEVTSETAETTTMAPKRQPCDGRGKLISRNGCVEHCMVTKLRFFELPYFTTIAEGEPCLFFNGFQALKGVCEKRSDRWREYSVCMVVDWP